MHQARNCSLCSIKVPSAAHTVACSSAIWCMYRSTFSNLPRPCVRGYRSCWTSSRPMPGPSLSRTGNLLVDNGYPGERRLDEAEVGPQAHLSPIEAHRSPRLARGTEARRGTLHTLHSSPRPSAGLFPKCRRKSDPVPHSQHFHTRESRPGCRVAASPSATTAALSRLFRCWTLVGSRRLVPQAPSRSFPWLLKRSPDCSPCVRV
jgi:hypothetical protein